MLHKTLSADFIRITDGLNPRASFVGRKVLITGASGFLGSYLVAFLVFLNQNFGFNVTIIALSRRHSAALPEQMRTLLRKNEIQYVQSDLSESATFPSSVDIVIHAASQASPVFYRTDPVGTLFPNVIGTFNLLNHYKSSLEKFIYISSGEVYGELQGLISEENFGYLDPASPRACYGESKRMGENICISFQQQYECNVLILRPFHTYGPGLTSTDGRVFSDFIFAAARGEDLCLTSDGQAKRPFLYVSDFVSAFCIAFESGEVGPFNVANNSQLTSIKDLAKRVTEITGVSSSVRFAKADGDYLKSPIETQLVSTSKLSALGWSPIIDISEGFARTIEYVRELECKRF